ncbi:MAG: endonuclease/exonuclease/phosphatase family protein [Verrucomicrobiota bacterium]
MSESYKVIGWNIEHLGKLLKALEEPDATAGKRARLEGIYQAILEMNPDVLCITEGPQGDDAIDTFVAGLPGYVAVKRPPGDPYGQQGTQWIWFVIKEALAPHASLLPIKVWREYTRIASPDEEHRDKWPVYRWGKIVTSNHSHYRHPQVLLLNLNGVRLEIIGGHFKSKITQVGNFNSPDEDKRRAYIEETLENRMKLATEAQNVRYYIDQRFAQEPHPAIMLMGDLNDGPGKELFERQFLFFDLLNNLQGDVFQAEKFLNHALFDFPNDLRWSAYFKDRLDPNRDPHILLDHILFTQSLVRNQFPFQVKAGAGYVEHEIYDRLGALLPNNQSLSDHRPVSCLLTPA